jgi:Tol biopolymer transport system component
MRIYVVPANGGNPTLLLSGDFNPTDPTWSPDGKSIAYSGVSIVDGAGTEIRILDLATRQSRTIPGSQHMFSARWSPDGQYLVAQSDDMVNLFLYSFATGKWTQLTPRGTFNSGWESWSHDGRYVFAFVDGKIMRISIPEGSSKAVVDLNGLRTTDPIFPGGSWFGLTPDDRVVMLFDRGTDEVYSLDLDYR